MLDFWGPALAIGLLAALLLIRPLLSGSRRTPARAAHDVAVFRDQLAAVDRDLERGALSPEEAEGAKAEVSRRLLAAAAEAEREDGAGPAPKTASRLLAAACAALVLGGGAGLYLALGSPQARDLPLAQRMEDMRQEAADRLSQEEIEARIAADGGEDPAPPPGSEEMLALVDRLRGILADRPDDVRGRRMLANALMNLRDAKGAWRAQEEAIRLMGDEAPFGDHALAAEAMIIAAQGYVSPEAEAHLRAALRKNPQDESSRYYAGLALVQGGRHDLALTMWTELLREGPADAPWKAPILSMIEDVSLKAGQPVPQVAYAAYDALQAARAGGGGERGPTAEDMRNAEDMTPEDRAAMIEGMVAGLENELATQGGAPGRWAQLIRAYGALGRPDDIERIMGSAREVFAPSPETLAEMEEVAAGAMAQARAGGAPGIGDGARAAAPETPAGPFAAPPAAPRAGPFAGDDAPRGPDAEDIRNARDMDAEGRAAMIEGMVARLEDELTSEGGAPSRWAQLLNAYGVLGRAEDVERIRAAARDAFAGQDETLAMIEEAGDAALARARAGGAPGMGGAAQ